MTGVLDSDDWEAADTLARCGLTITRLLNGEGDNADIDAAIADLLSLPDDVPQRGPLAGALVAVLLRYDRAIGPRHLRHLDTLLEIADQNPPPWPEWSRQRSMARLLSTVRAGAEGEPADTDIALAELNNIAQWVGDHPKAELLHRLMRVGLGFMRAFQHGDEAALRQLPVDIEQLRGLVDDPELGPMANLLEKSIRMLLAHQRGDHDTAVATFDEVRRNAEVLPPDNFVRNAVDQASTMMAAFLPILGGRTADQPIPALSDEQRAAMQELADRPEASRADRAYAQLALAAADLRGWDETDVDRIDSAIARFREALSAAPPGNPERPFRLQGLALGLWRRFEVTGKLDGLAEAEQALTEARELAGGPANPHWSLINEMLSYVQRRLGQRPDARKVALEGLRRHAWHVLLQTDTAAATTAARNAASDAVQIASGCLIDNDPGDAIHALDAGRGLVLFAATELRDITTRLDAAGRSDLAHRWRVAAASTGSDTVPVELRREVLDVLARPTGVGIAGSGGRLDPPSLPEIQSALLALDADALVYLVPAQPPTPGWAVIAPAHGPPSFIPLPNLSLDEETDVERYLTALSNRDAALRQAEDGPGSEARATAGTADPDGTRDLVLQRADARFVGALDALCDWAWRAAVGPLVERYLPSLPAPASGRPHRVVLVPMGALSRVPWHAARRPDRTYAVQLAAFSQAVSARMLCESASRAPVPLAPVGLVVGDPDTGRRSDDLAAARIEAYAIHQAFYRGGRYVGRRPDGLTSRSGAGTRAQIRDWLTSTRPGAGAMLHLACHGVLEVGAEDTSAYLLLAGRERLTAEELIGLLAEAPERAIGLVVLAACRTGVSSRGYDEAYSLGTAFLAGGVRSVLSTQWSIPDRATSVLMFMFHHYLMAERRPAWDALRRAQLWMLDADRRPPETMPAPLRRQLHQTDPAQIAAWAGFVHWGQ